jgi:hypothetical protein
MTGGIQCGYTKISAAEVHSDGVGSQGRMITDTMTFRAALPERNKVSWTVAIQRWPERHPGVGMWRRFKVRGGGLGLELGDH